MPGTSTPLTPNQIRAALRKFGCKVREIPGWETRNRAGHGLFGPVYGFVVHHTGDDAPDTADRNVIINGRAGLPGPLAQFGLNDDSAVDLIGCGRANHAGTGDPDVLAAVRDETFGAYPPKPNQKTTDGNRYFYGVETYYSGKQRPQQYDAMVNLAAAICDAHGWTAKSVIGHKEWSYTKPDPGSVDMAEFRAAVDARIKAVNSGRATDNVTSKPKPAQTPEVPDMQFSDIVPGSNPPVSLGVAALRALAAYPRVLEGGWLDKRLDVVESSIGALRSAIEADDKAQAQAILDRIEVSLTVKPDDAPAP